MTRIPTRKRRRAFEDIIKEILSHLDTDVLFTPSDIARKIEADINTVKRALNLITTTQAGPKIERLERDQGKSLYRRKPD